MTKGRRSGLSTLLGATNPFGCPKEPWKVREPVEANRAAHPILLHCANLWRLASPESILTPFGATAHPDERRPACSRTPRYSGFAVDDLQRAREFYEATLGLTVSEANGLLTLHLAGGRATRVYPKPEA